MSTDLKKENDRNIFLILTGAILLSAGLQHGFSKLPEWSEFIIAGTASPIFAAVLVMTSNLLPHNIKHKLVFTRFKNEMPAGRVHKLSQQDPRIDIAQAKVKWPDIFDDGVPPAQRNSRWYGQIYTPVKDKPEVLQAHRNFLLYRDAFSGLIMLLMFAGFWNWQGNHDLIEPFIPSVFYALSGFTFLSLVAARFAGHRFVVNAVAVALSVGR